MADILVSPLGRSPGAVSGVYFALQQAGFEIGEIVTVGTSHPDVRAAAENYLVPLFRHLQVKYDPIHVPGNDLKDGKRNIAPYVAMVELALKNAQGSDHQVHVAITGGRSGMGALAALATNFYGADHLWHLWVRQDIEEGGTVDRLSGLFDVEAMKSSPFLNPTVEGKQAYEAVELPFLDLRPLHDVLWSLRRTGQVPSIDKSLIQILSNAGVNQSLEVVGTSRGQEGADLEPERLSRLWQNLTRYFSIGEIHTLCFVLEVDFDDLPGEGKADKARELILYLNRRNRVPELVAKCLEQRPRVAWDKVQVAGQAHAMFSSDVIEMFQVRDVFPAGLTFSQADRILELRNEFTRESSIQARFKIMTELGELLQQAGAVDEVDRQTLIDLVSGQSAPQDLYKFAQAARTDRLGVWKWMMAHKDEIDTSAKVGAVGVSLFTALLTALQLYLKASGYIS